VTQSLVPPAEPPEGPRCFLFNLWDVSTDPATLNAKVNNPNFAIYNDLGSGVNYGSFVLPTSGNPNDILNFSLDPAAVAAINAAEGGYFSIGGAIPLSSIVPEPSTFVLMGSGLLGMVGLARRKFRQ
jgi:PEP-CTERM motif